MYLGRYLGTTVAVKSMVLPSMASGAARKERMAIVEAAISSALRHPNVIQVKAPLYCLPLRPQVTFPSGLK